MMNRAELWRSTEVPLHLSLIDNDLDQNDRAHDAIRADVAAELAALKAKMEKGFERCEADSDALRKLLVSLLVAVVTTSIGIIATIVAMSAT